MSIDGGFGLVFNVIFQEINTDSLTDGHIQRLSADKLEAFFLIAENDVPANKSEAHKQRARLFGGNT